jgi:hypothetical protein
MNAQTMTLNQAGLQQSSGMLSPSNKILWAGRVLSALPALLLLSSGINIALKAPVVMESFDHLGYPESTALGIGIAQFLCALLYVIPRTSILGAALLTAYLGGATASHVRVGDPFFGPIICAVLLCAGLFLRDSRLRALVFSGTK